MGIKWLKWVSVSENLDIQHARNGGEVRIGNYKVDGCRRNSKYVYEFYGCAVGCFLLSVRTQQFQFHGCPKCFPNRMNTLPLSDVTADDALMKTMRRQHELACEGYTVEIIWECEFNRMIKTDPKLKEFIAKVNVHDPLDPRDGFFGGTFSAPCI